MKKEDISKGLSKIKKSSKTLIEEVSFQFNSKFKVHSNSKGKNLIQFKSQNSIPQVYWKETRFAGVAGRRKISLSQLLSTDQPELRGATTSSGLNNVSTFYVAGPTSSPSLALAERKGSSPRETVSPSPMPSNNPAALPVAPSRRRSGKTGRSVVRPLNPPPAPPLPTSPPPSLDLDINKVEAESIYTSSLFKSEPLYQFYQEREALQEHIYLQSAPTESGGLLEEIEADPVYQASRLQDPIFDASRRQLSPPKNLIKPTLPPDSSNGNPWGPGPVQGLLNSPDQRTLWAELPQVIPDQKLLISTLKDSKAVDLISYNTG